MTNDISRITNNVNVGALISSRNRPTTQQTGLTSGTGDSKNSPLDSSRVSLSGSVLNQIQVDTKASINQITNADMAIYEANAAKHSILQNSKLAMMAQANTSQNIAVRLLG